MKHHCKSYSSDSSSFHHAQHMAPLPTCGDGIIHHKGIGNCPTQDPLNILIWVRILTCYVYIPKARCENFESPLAFSLNETIT